MRRPRTYHVVERGTRLPGGSITWRTEVEASDWFYASHVCGVLTRAGHLFRRREIQTSRAIPVSAAEAAWHAAHPRNNSKDRP
jgi:hypothetical protein